jgi:alpha-tubulin suppressor-like RCC1 family protein
VPCAGLATVALKLALTLGAMASFGCQPLSQIILIIDSNLPADQLVSVELTIMGPSSMKKLPLSPNPPQTPPWTMGLVPSGDATPWVSVSAKASNKDGAEVIEQDANTEFVSGESRLLRILLLTSCMGVVCPDGQVCGANGCGPIEQLGASLPTWNGDIPPRPSPDPTLPILGRSVWAGGWHSCAIEGTVLYCWGQNKYGELGNNTTLQSSDRQRIVLPPNTALPLRAVGLGNINTCVCDGSGKAYCWGDDSSGQIGNPAVSAAAHLPVPVPGLTDCVQIGGGGAHMCAVHADATVSCWGSNSYGQAGGKGPVVATPTLVADMAGVAFANVLEVFGGEDFTCARRMDKTVWCWGNNADHRLGDGTTVARNTPVQVAGVVGAEELAIGRFTACARLTGGTVMCWGQNTSGQLGTGDTKATRLPVQVAGITDATQISLGRDHACLLHASPVETVACWGSNTYGQLGIGAGTGAGPPVLKPTTIDTIGGVSSIAAGSVHTCARHSKGLSCWGENVVNELGDNTTTNRAQPVLVSDFP